MVISFFSTVPSDSLEAEVEISESDPMEAGDVGPTLTCTVNETIPGLSNMPSAAWMGPGVSENGTTAEDNVRNATTAIKTLSFYELHTSHAGLYICEGTLVSPAAEDGIITNSTTPVSVTVKCE